MSRAYYEELSGFEDAADEAEVGLDDAVPDHVYARIRSDYLDRRPPDAIAEDLGLNLDDVLICIEIMQEADLEAERSRKTNEPTWPRRVRRLQAALLSLSEAHRRQNIARQADGDSGVFSTFVHNKARAEGITAQSYANGVLKRYNEHRAAFNAGLKAACEVCPSQLTCPMASNPAAFEAHYPKSKDRDALKQKLDKDPKHPC